MSMVGGRGSSPPTAPAVAKSSSKQITCEDWGTCKKEKVVSCPLGAHLLSCRNYRPPWCHQQSQAWWGAFWVSENMVGVFFCLLTALWGGRGDHWRVGT